MSEISVKQLEAEAKTLLVRKRKIDPQDIVNLQIFKNFEQKCQNLAQNESISTKKLLFLQKELQALSIYLAHFSLFLALYEQFLQREKMAQKDVAFHQANYFIELTLEIFTQGKYLEIGVVEQIELLRNAIANLKKRSENVEKTVEKNENLPLFNEFKAFQIKNKTQKNDIHAFVAQKKIYKNPLSAAKFAKLKKAYDSLKHDMMRYVIRREDYKYRFFLAHFTDALRSHDAAKMQQFLDKAKKEIVETRIEEPKNNAVLEDKLVNISGKGEANTYVLILINEKQKIKAEIDKNERFYVPDVELNFGENMIVYENEKFGFIEDKPKVLHLQVNKTHLFLGRYDPLTQKAFELNELYTIVRCKACHNFSYNFSVEENEGRCIIKKCESKAFYTAKDAKFWVK